MSDLRLGYLSTTLIIPGLIVVVSIIGLSVLGNSAVTSVLFDMGLLNDRSSDFSLKGLLVNGDRG